jgi:Zn-dependent protease
MIEILAIVLALVLLIVSMMVRNFAGVVLPRIRVQFVPEHAPPVPYADLYAGAAEQLAALGFDPGIWLLVEFDPPESGAHRLMRWHRHRTECATATVCAPIDLARPNLPTVAISTQLADGRQLITSAFLPLLRLIASRSCLRQDVTSADIAQQWQAHQSWRAEFEVEAEARSLDPVWEAHEGVTRYHAHLDELVAEGRAVPDAQRKLRLSWRTIVAALLAALRSPRTQLPATPVPIARVLALFRVFDLGRLRQPAASTQWLLFGVSAALFSVLGALLWDLTFALALLAVIAFHEAGHWLAMRLLGYRNLQVLMIPLLGGVALGIEQHPSATRRALVSLMGPLPGVLLGWALWSGAIPLPLEGDGMLTHLIAQLPLLLLVLNYLNLLPVPPLDGGHFVQALLPRQWARVELMFLLLAAAAGLALAWYLGSVLIALLVALQIFAVRTHLREGKVARELAAAAPDFASHAEAEQRRRALEAWTPYAPAGLSLPKLLAQVETVRQLAALTPPRPATRLVLLVLYALLFAVPALLLAPALCALRPQFG